MACALSQPHWSLLPNSNADVAVKHPPGPPGPWGTLFGGLLLGRRRPRYYGVFVRAWVVPG